MTNRRAFLRMLQRASGRCLRAPRSAPSAAAQPGQRRLASPVCADVPSCATCCPARRPPRCTYAELNMAMLQRSDVGKPAGLSALSALMGVMPVERAIWRVGV